MLEDNEIEEVAATATNAYMNSTNLDEFIEIMDNSHYNTPHYVYRIMYKSIRQFDGA